MDFPILILPPPHALFYQSQGHSAGVAAAMVAESGGTSVHDLDLGLLHAKLLADGQILDTDHNPDPKPSSKAHYSCDAVAMRCIGKLTGAGTENSTCDGECSPLSPHEWWVKNATNAWIFYPILYLKSTQICRLANRDTFTFEGASLRANSDTFLKKTELHSRPDNPASVQKAVAAGKQLLLATKPLFYDNDYAQHIQKR